MKDATMKEIIALLKRRGFVYPSSEIYGGFGASYDYGPLGVETANNIKNCWRKDVVRNHPQVVETDGAIILNPKTWEASGHLGSGFADSLVECRKCHHRFKVEEVEKGICPDCGGETTEPRNYNLMMKTFIGPVEDTHNQAYLRPETCQSIFLDFKLVADSMRIKLPFGIAQIGKSFRNEINPKNFLYRQREFEQMEMEWFTSPEEADQWFDYWKERRLQWYLDLGMKKENLRLREVPKSELAHYAKRAVDVDYHFPFGWQEIEGIHNRGDFDLRNHSEQSGRDLSYQDSDHPESFYPHVIETSAGVGRLMLAFICDAYTKVAGGRGSESQREEEVVLDFSARLSPVEVAVFPLMKKPELVAPAQEIFKELNEFFRCQYDVSGSIGRRYRRQDEIGTPLAVTIDLEGLENDDVTLRDRVSMKQIRVKRDCLVDKIRKALEGDFLEDEDTSKKT
jgi:glycyl-tRNA synthetase